MKKRDLQKRKDLQKKKDNKSLVNRSDSNMAGKPKKKEESKAKPLKSLDGDDELKSGNGGRVTRHSKKMKVGSEDEHVVESVDLVESADGVKSKQKKPGKLSDKEMPVRTTRSRVGAEVATVASSPVEKTRSGGGNTEKHDGVKKDVPVPVRTTRSRAGAEMPVIPTSPVGKKRRRGESDAANEEEVKEMRVLTTRSRMGAEVASLPSSPVEKKKRRIGGLDTEKADGVEKEIPVRATRSRGVELATLHSSPVEKKETRRGVKTDIEVKKDVPIRTTRSRMDAEIASLPSLPAEKKKTKGAGVNTEDDDGVKNEVPARTTRSRAGGEMAILPSFPVEEKETRRVKTNDDDGVKKVIPVRTTRSIIDADIVTLPPSTVEKKKTRRAVSTGNDDGVEKEMPVRTTRSRTGGEIASVPSAPVEKKNTTRGGVNTDNDVGVKDMPVRTARSRTGAEEANLPSSAVEKKKTTRGVDTENDDGVEKEMPVRTTRSRMGGEVASVPSAPVEKKKTTSEMANTDNDVGVRTTRSRTGADEANLHSSPVEKKKPARGVNTENDDGAKKETLVRTTRSRVGAEVASPPSPVGKRKTRRVKTDNADDAKKEIPVRTTKSRVGPDISSLPPSSVEKTKITRGRKTDNDDGFKKTSDATTEENVVQVTRSLRGKEILLDRVDTNLEKTDVSSKKRKREVMEDRKNEDEVGKVAILKKNTRQTRKRGDKQEDGKADLPLDKDITDIQTVKGKSKKASTPKEKAERQSKRNACTSDNSGKRDSENVSKPEPPRRSRRTSPAKELVNSVPNDETSAQSKKAHAESNYPAEKSSSIRRHGKMVSKPAEQKLDIQEKVELSPQKLTESSYKTVPTEAPDDVNDELVVPATEEIVAAEHASPLNSPIHRVKESADDSLVVTETGSAQVDNETARFGCGNEGDLETMGNTSAFKKATNLSTSTEGIAKTVSESNSLEEEGDHIEIQVIQVEPINDIDAAAEKTVNTPGEFSLHVMESEIRNEEVSPFSEEIPPLSAGETSPECNISGAKNVGEEPEKVSVKDYTSSLEDKDKIVHHEHGEQADDHVVTSVADNAKFEELVDNASIEDFTETHLEIGVGEFVGEVSVFQQVNELGQTDTSVDVGSPTGTKEVSIASCINSVFTYNEARESTEAKEIAAGALEFNSEDVGETSIVKNQEVLEGKVEEASEEIYVCNSDKLNARVSCEVNEKNKTLESSVEGFGDGHVREGASMMFQESQDLLGKGVIVEEHRHCDTSSPVSQVHALGNIGLDFEDVSEASVVESREGLEEKIEEIRGENSDCNTDKFNVKVSCEVVEKNATLEAPVEEFSEEHASKDVSTMLHESPDLLGKRVISEEHHDCDTSSVKTLSSPVSVSKGIEFEDVSEALIVKSPEILERSIEEFKEENSDCDSDKLNVKVSCEVDENNVTPEASVVEFGEEHVREDASVVFQKSPDLLGNTVTIEEHHDCNTSSINTPSSPVCEAQTPGGVGLDFEDVDETSFVKNQEVLEEKIEEVSEDIIGTSVVNIQEVSEEKMKQVRDDNSDHYSDKLNVKISSQVDEKNEILEASVEKFGEEHVHEDASVMFQEPVELHGESAMVEDFHDCDTVSIIPLSSPVSQGNAVLDFEDYGETSSVKSRKVSEEKNEDVAETLVVKSLEDLEEKIEEVREENCDYNRDTLDVKVSCEVDEKNGNLESLREDFGEDLVREDASTVFQESPKLLTKSVMIEDNSEALDSAVSQAHNPGVEEFEFQAVGETSIVKNLEVLEENIEEVREENCDGNSDKLKVKVSCEVDEKNETLEASSLEEVGEEHVASTMFKESQEQLGESLAIEEHPDRGTSSIETLSSPVWQGNVGLDFHHDSEATVAKSPDVLEENTEEVREQNSDCNLDEQNMKVSCEVDEKNESLVASEEFIGEHVGEQNIKVSCEVDEKNESLVASEEFIEEHVREDASTMIQKSPASQGNVELDFKDVDETSFLKGQEFLEEKIQDRREESYDCNSEKLNMKVSCEVTEKIETLEASVKEFGEDQVREDASMMFQESPESLGKASLEKFGEEHVREDASMMLQESSEYSGKSVIVEEHPDDNCDRNSDKLNVMVSCEVDGTNEILETSVEEAGEEHVREDALTRLEESLELLGNSSVEEHVKEDASMMFQELREEYPGGSVIVEEHPDENCDHSLDKHNVKVYCEVNEEIETVETSVEEFGEGHVREDASMMFQVSPKEYSGKSLIIEELPNENCDHSSDELNVKVSYEETEILEASVEEFGVDEFGEGNVREDTSIMFQMSPEEYPGKSSVIEEHPNENCDHGLDDYEETETLEASVEEFCEENTREDGSIGGFEDSPDLLGTSVRIEHHRDCYTSSMQTLSPPASQAQDPGNVEIYFKDFDETSFNYQGVLEEGIEEFREENCASNLDKHNANVEELVGAEHVREDASMMFQGFPELHGKNVDIEEHRDCDTSVSQDNVEREDNLLPRENNDWSPF